MQVRSASAFPVVKRAHQMGFLLVKSTFLASTSVNIRHSHPGSHFVTNKGRQQKISAGQRRQRYRGGKGNEYSPSATWRTENTYFLFCRGASADAAGALMGMVLVIKMPA